jgi:hypothetical protein
VARRYSSYLIAPLASVILLFATNGCGTSRQMADSSAPGMPSLSSAELYLLLQQQAYQVSGGGRCRGPRFAGALSSIVPIKDRIDELHVLLLLGSPDYYIRGTRTVSFAYLFSTSKEGGQKGEVAYLDFNDANTVNRIGFNTASEVDSHIWLKYDGFAADLAARMKNAK